MVPFKIVGVDFKVKVVDAMDSNGRPKRVKVTIWDTGNAPTTSINIVCISKKNALS